MSPVDTTWLRMDRSTNPMHVVGCIVLGPPFDAHCVEQALRERLLAIPRFSQRAEEQGAGWCWATDENLDPTRHLRRLRLPQPGGKTELQQFVSELASTPLDPAHPLWQFHIVEDFDGGAAIVCRIHHAVGDGMALLAVLLSLTDGHEARAWPTRHNHAGSSSVLRPAVEVLGEVLRLTGDVWRGSLGALENPAPLVRGGAAVASELAYLLTMPTDSVTRFKGRPSGNKRVAWSEPMRLPEVSVIAKALDCSINDMLLTAVAGALQAYLIEAGDPVEGVELRALVPVNLRSAASARELGNKFGVVAIELPLGLAPLARLREVHRRMDALKQSYEAPVTLGLIAALGYTPKVVQDEVFDLLLSRATAVMTNVPGPQIELRLGGSPIKEIMFWVPQAGEIGMGVSILSYNGQVQFGLMTDAALVPDPERIVNRFGAEFEQLLYYVLLEGWGALANADER